MAVNRAVVEASPDTVFAVLSDPSAYARFVVGTKRIRRFEPSWPEPGTHIHHTVGVGPFTLRDQSRVTECDDSRRLVLRAEMRPFAVNVVAFTLRPEGTGTEVEVEEYAIEGPAALVWNPAFEAIMWLRNQEMLRRLTQVVERRARLRAKAPAG